MSGRNYPEFIDQSKLSAEEFCRKLCLWFEDQGLMSELRAHMRSLMITSLRGTSLGPKPATKTISPKFQAINLLVAEFLMQQQCHYTLSVFSVEASVHDFTMSVGSTVKGRVSVPDKPAARFQQRDLLDILETLGISPDSVESERIMSLYRESDSSEALLTCIFRILPAMLQNRDSSKRYGGLDKDNVFETPTRDFNTSTVKFSNHILPEWTSEIFSEDIQKILSPTTLKAEQVQRLQKFLESKVSRARKEEELKYQRELIDRERILQENLIQRDCMFRQLIDESQDRMIHEKNDLQKGRQEMNEIAGQMRQNHEQMARRLKELEEWGETLRIKELHIAEQKRNEAIQMSETTSKLSVRQQQLDLEFQRLQREREEVEAFQHSVAELKRSLENATRSKFSDAAAQAELQQECIFLRRELDSARHLLNKQHCARLDTEKQSHQVCSKETDDLYSQHVMMAREMCHQLQEENSELRSRVRQQERRIEELTTRASDLAAELQDTNTALILLNSREAEYPTNRDWSAGSNFVSRPAAPVPPAPNAPQPPPLPAQRSVSPDRFGSGKETVIDPNVMNRSVPTPQRGRSVQHRETLRTPPKRLVVYNQSSSDEVSPTEETLHEARHRLRAIEEESQVVDRRIKDFRRRFLESTTSAMLYPYSQTTMNPSLSTHTSTATQQLKRNHVPTSGFRSEFENSLPSYTRLNTRPSLYEQVSAANAQSRTGRKTHLFQHSSSSDNENSETFPYQAQNADFITHRPSARVQHREQAQSLSRISPEIAEKSPTRSVPATRPLSTKRLSKPDSVKQDSLRLSVSSNPQPATSAPETQSVSTCNKPQTSQVVKTKRKGGARDASRNVDQTPPTAEPDVRGNKMQQSAVEESVALPKAHVASRLTNQSIGHIQDVSHGESSSNVPVSSVLVLLDAPTGEMLSSDTDTSSRSSSRVPQEQIMSKDEFNPKSILDKAQNSNELILNQETVVPTSEKDVVDLVKPLRYPQLQLDTSRLDGSVGNLPEEKVNQQVEQLLVGSLQDGVACSATNTSGSVLEGVSPQGGDVSLSSMELSSDKPVSGGDDKGKAEISDNDFWS